MKIFIVIHQNQIEIMYKTYSIIGILFSVLLFAACSKHEPIISEFFKLLYLKVVNI